MLARRVDSARIVGHTDISTANFRIAGNTARTAEFRQKQVPYPVYAE